MNKQWMAAAAVAGLVSVWSAAAAASAPETHDGFFFQGSIGPGYLSTSPSVDGSDIDQKISGFGVGGGLLFGGTPAPGLVIGGGTANVIALSPKWTVEGEENPFFDDADLTLNLSTLGVFGTFYPDPNAGLSLHLMLAYGVLSVSDSDGDDSDNNPSGFAVTAGVGYDFWVAPEWSIGVMGRFTYGALKYDEDDADVSFPTIAPALLATFTYH